MESTRFEIATTAMIILNAVSMGMVTYGNDHSVLSGTVGFDALTSLQRLDEITLFWFSIEVLVRLYALRSEFRRDGWNLFDDAIVLTSWGTEVPFLAALRVLRVLICGHQYLRGHHHLPPG